MSSFRYSLAISGTLPGFIAFILLQAIKDSISRFFSVIVSWTLLGFSGKET